MSEDDSLVSAAEVARLADVGRAAVSNWRRRYPDFPEAVEGGATSPKFRLTEIERWLREQGKLGESVSEDALWRRLSVGRSETDLTRLLLQTVRYLHDPQDTPDLPQELRHQVDQVATEPPVELVESLYGRYFDRQQRRQSITPPELADLMVTLADARGTVLDPACGPGNALRAAAVHGASRLLGQELDEELARLAQARMRFYAPCTIEGGDALRADAHPDARADAVLCEPPFGYRDWGYAELSVDRRWEYGLPVKNEPELAWLQHCLAHTRAGGSVVMLLPAAVASRRSGRAIRKELIRRGTVRAVFALPPGLLLSTGIPLHLWVLRSPGEEEVDPVLLVDAGEHSGKRRGDADWAALRSAVLQPWQEFTARGTVTEMAGRQRAIAAIELLDEDVDLTPARHLPLPPTEIDSAALERTRLRLTEQLASLAGRIPELRGKNPQAHSTMTIAELARAGALTLRQHIGKLELDDNPDATGPLVLTGRDVATHAHATMRLGREPGVELVPLAPGDLVIPHVAAGERRPAARVIDEHGLMLGPNLQLVRVDPERLDAEFLAGYLTAGRSVEAHSSTLSGARRLDVRRIEVPLLGIEQQRRIGAAFRGLRTFSSELREVAELGEELVTQLIDGLAEGSLEPHE